MLFRPVSKASKRDYTTRERGGITHRFIVKNDVTHTESGTQTAKPATIVEADGVLPNCKDLAVRDGFGNKVRKASPVNVEHSDVSRRVFCTRYCDSIRSCQDNVWYVWSHIFKNRRSLVHV